MSSFAFVVLATHPTPPRTLLERLAGCLLVGLLFAGALAPEVTNGQEQGPAELGEVAWQVSDQEGQPLAARVHLFNAVDEPIAPAGVPFFHDHFAIDGRQVTSLPAGDYRYEIARGHEFIPVTGTLTVRARKREEVRTRLTRRINLADAGWYSGDLHIHRPLPDVPLLMRAEELHIGPVISWWNANSAWQGQQLPPQTRERFDGQRFLDVMGGEDEREAGALLFFGLAQPLDLTQATREYPSPMEFVAQARQQNPEVWLDIEKPFWWDVPVWLALADVDSIGIAHNHMHRRGVLDNEAWGRPRDRERFPGNWGNGFWTQSIYYQALNAGLRLPPSAGSASGVLPNPVGFNRVYVHLTDDLSWQAWWKGLATGRCFVTNGPLLRVTANKQLPGHAFATKDHAPRSFEITYELDSNVPVTTLELISNGEVVQQIKLDAVHKATGKLQLQLAQSGWFLLRGRCEQEENFRFAATGPFYVEFPQGGCTAADRAEVKQRIATAARFFTRWIEQRIPRVAEHLDDSTQQAEVLRYHRRALRFWEELAD